MSLRRRAYIVLAVGVLIVAWAAILIRWAGTDEAPPLVRQAAGGLLGWLVPLGVAGSARASPLAIAAGRMVLAALLLTPVALGRGAPRELRALGRGELLLAGLAGLALAVHFATWITSLSIIDVATSVVLVQTNPLFVALLSYLFLRERLSRPAAVGIFLALAGCVVIGLEDLRQGGAQLTGPALLGDILALTGGLMAAIYFLLGRRLRRRLSIVAYIWPVYTTAAVTLLVICLLTGQSLLGYEPVTYLMLLLLAIGPQLLGHSSLNYALGHLSATLVTIAALGEPIGSALLALALLGQMPAALTLVGGALILGGIVLAAGGEGRQTASPALPT